MSSYNDFLKVVKGLPSGTVFEITVDWCRTHGLIVNSNIVKSFGHTFRREFAQHNCSHLGKGTDNHNFYKKL